MDSHEIKPKDSYIVGASVKKKVNVEHVHYMDRQGGYGGLTQHI